MFNSIALLIITVCYGICLVKAKKDISVLEDMVFDMQDRVMDIEDTVESHWKATRNECNGIWDKINGE